LPIEKFCFFPIRISHFFPRFVTANQGLRSNMLGSLPRMESLSCYNEVRPNSYHLTLLRIFLFLSYILYIGVP
jgi:hypothetical protein